jgi:hypothetical protein
MQFYSVKHGKPVEVKDYKVKKLSNGRYQAVGNYNGTKVYKFVKGPGK